MATVGSVSLATPNMREIVLNARNAAQVGGAAGNDVMVRLNKGNDQFVRRRYSVRSVDDDSQIRLWVSMNHEGAGASWAATAQPGDLVDLVGPRGKIVLNLEAAWHLFVGDTSALGAFYRMAESLRAPSHVIFVIELESPTDMTAASIANGVHASTIYVERRGRSAGDPTTVLNGLAALALPPGMGQAYLFGEHHSNLAARDALIDQGMKLSQIAQKAFWRAGTGNGDHGEPPKE